MATVEFFPAFGYEWAENGAVFAWDDAQYKLGWATIGSTPPTVEQFNRVLQVLDEKSNWLFGHLETVADAKGVTLSAGDLTGLQQVLSAYTPDASTTVKGLVELATTAETTTGTDATRSVTPAGLKGALPGIIPHGESIITATGNWVSPIAGYIDVQVWAGGGGGGGIGSTGGVGGGGGGGGGYARWRGTVTLGQTISCTVGALGSGGGAGAGGGVGGNSAFGAFATTTGGGGGASNASGNGGTGGLGSAGTITAGGADGNAASTALGGGGGSASFGGAGGGAGVGPSGLGMRPGGGGGGRGPGTVGSGANGGAGLIIVTW